MIIKWSESDIEYIKANFQNTKYKDLAAKFGTTTDSIKRLSETQIHKGDKTLLKVLLLVA